MKMADETVSEEKRQIINKIWICPENHKSINLKSNVYLAKELKSKVYLTKDGLPVHYKGNIFWCPFCKRSYSEDEWEIYLIENGKKEEIYN